MNIIYIGILLLGCACANDDAQYENVKSVKGGHRGGSHYNPANYPSFYNGTQGQHYGGYIMRHNMTHYGHSSLNTTTTRHVDYSVGVCYIEVPTATLVRNPAQLPTGNGSRPDLSRIRSCCKGYIRNIHNYKICDPVCSKECVNALCSAPETCTCFPDHVKNLAGFCIPICPIGCQNGYCSGGECLCNQGFKLDSESKYCIPTCKENCGGIGNCTDSNTCDCKAGYQSTADGNCKPVCDRCNDDCIAPNDCRCKPGYGKDQRGQCVPQCPSGCGPNGRCTAPNVCDQTGAVPANQPGNPYPLYPGNQINNHIPGNRTYPGQIYTQNSTQDKNQLFTDNQIYSGSFNQGDPGQPRQPLYQVQPGQPGQSGYPGQSWYPGQPGYLGQPGSQDHSAYPGQPGSHGQSGHPGQPGSVDHFGSPNQSGYPGQPGQPGYPGQSVFPGQAGYPGQSTYPGQPGYQRPPEYPGQSGYPRQPGYPNSSGYTRPNGYPLPTGQREPASQNQNDYYGQQSQQTNRSHSDQLGNPSQPGYNGQSSSHSYPPSNGLSGYGQQSNINNYNQCAEPCINGACYQGFCRCNPGYILDTKDFTESRCIPNCPGGCPNGVCSAPHFCICDVGFYKDTSVKGRQTCVKRIRRSIQKPRDLSKLIVYKNLEY